MYILLTEENTAAEIIPEEDAAFPGVPVEKRYAPDFVERLLHVPEGTEVEPNWTYDAESGTFAPPPETEAQPEPDPEPGAPTLTERVTALENETAALTAAVERGLAL